MFKRLKKGSKWSSLLKCDVQSGQVCSSWFRVVKSVRIWCDSYSNRLDRSEPLFKRLNIPLYVPNDGSTSGGGLHSAVGGRGLPKDGTLQGWKARAQLYDGHATHQAGESSKIYFFTNSNARNSGSEWVFSISIFIYDNSCNLRSGWVLQ